MASGEQRCKAKSACINQAVAWEYPTMGPPRVICRTCARKSKARLAPFWGELGFDKEPSESLTEAIEDIRRDISNAVTPSEYREWAKANGWEIGDRGRVSLEIKQAYHEQN